MSRRCAIASRTLQIAAGLLFVAACIGIRAQEPAYPHGQYEDDCTMCHSGDSWKPAVISPAFDHAKSGFALRGAHQQTDCRSCHLTLEFKRADPSCASCHDDVHNGEFGPACSECHSTRSFIDRAVMERRHVSTRFPLRGAHRATDCDACHRPTSGGAMQFVNTPVECVTCHRADYESTTQPDHEAGGFPTRCQACHSSFGWSPAGFDHANVAGTPCVDCHLANYQATSNPDHEQSGIPQTCENCHATTAWTPASFDHQSVAGTPCATCHLGDYQGTTDPDHAGAGIPQTCEDCHTTTAWTPANFDHQSVAGTPCATCHLGDFQATSDPSHVQAPFPQTCEDCHTSTSTWLQIRFSDHDPLYFPIYSGAHQGRWSNDCSECHMVPAYATFTCIDCHAHDNPSSVANDHQGVSGYQYTSQACYSCHPRGRS